jgi:hypothetical protein
VVKSNPSLPRPRLYIDAYDVDARLARDGIERGWLVDAAQRGDLERKRTSHLELPGAPAYKAASKGLEVLRMASLDSGWHPELHLGIPVTISGDRRTAITVTEGDENTGHLTDDDPVTKAYKGVNTARAADDNRLFEDPPVAFFYLLTYSLGGILRAELSSPRITEGGHVSAWLERILLGDIGPGDDPRVAAKPTAPVVAPPIAVMRKTG